MDIPAVQSTLRRFAAELLRFADRTSIELDASPGGKTHVLIDWENVQPTDVDVRALVPDATDLWLFHGPNQKNVTAHYASFGERATPVRIARTGKNALDFHLTFYIGYIASRQPEARFVVISNDKGYGPMLEHAKELGFAADQVGFVRLKSRTAATRKAAETTRAGAGAIAKTARKPRTPASTSASASTSTRRGKAAGAAPAAPASASTRRSTATQTARKRSSKASDAAPSAIETGARPATSRRRASPAAPPTAKAVKTTMKAASPPASRRSAEPAAGRNEATKTASPAAPASAGTTPSGRRKPAATATGRAPGARTGKTFEQVLALLGKRPVDRLAHKQARLLADIAQMIGAAADSAEAQAMLDRLVAAGKVLIDERRTVRYAL